MNSKFLYELYLLSVITKAEIIAFVEREQRYLDNVNYYDILYNKAENKSDFLKILSSICNMLYKNNELEEKYEALIELFHRKMNDINIIDTLYHFSFSRIKELLEIDFDFWNFIQTDYELRRDGFEGLKNSSQNIRSFLQKNAKYKDMDIINLITIIAK